MISIILMVIVTLIVFFFGAGMNEAMSGAILLSMITGFACTINAIENNPQFFYKNSYKEINLERKHFPFLTYHKTKRDLNDEHIRQIPFIIYRLKSIKNPVKTQKNGIPDRSRATTFRLEGKPSIQIRYRYNIFSFIIFINSSTKTN